MAGRKTLHAPYQEHELAERRFNAWQQWAALMNADAAYRALFVGWAPLVIGVALVSAYRPLGYDMETLLVILYCFSMYVFFYTAISVARRTTLRYICKLFADNPEEWGKIHKDYKYAVEYFNNTQPYFKTGDPPLARCIHRTMERLGFPKRGTGHAVVFIFYVVNLLACIWMFVSYLQSGDAHAVPPLFWKWCAVVLFASLCNMVENFSFLLNLKLFVAAVDTALALVGRHSNLLGRIDPEHALATSMVDYRFRRNKPLVPGCGQCVGHMSAHVAGEVPMVVLPNIEKAELLNTIMSLMTRSPKLFACLGELRRRLELNPNDIDGAYSEFKRILMDSPELVQAFTLWHEESHPPQKE